MEAISKPKKRIFLALVLASTIVTAAILYLIWKVSVPGLTEINTMLPAIFGWLIITVVGIFFIGELGIVLAILGVPMIKIIYYWAWKAINFLFPFAVGLGRIFNISKSSIEQSFVEVNNNLIMQNNFKIPAEKIMILTPHCIQLDTCVHKITRNIDNCRTCGNCSVGDMLTLARKYGIHMAVATGGTLARQMVMKVRPKAIIAVACERDLTSGIQDVFPMPVIGVMNERPFGPCFNTRVDIAKVEEAILFFLDKGDNDGR